MSHVDAEDDARGAVENPEWRRTRDAHAGVNTRSARYITYEGGAQGQEWEHPRHDGESYPAGWAVAHGGKDWTSDEASNVDEPGVRAWTQSGAARVAGEVTAAEGS